MSACHVLLYLFQVSQSFMAVHTLCNNWEETERHTRKAVATRRRETIECRRWVHRWSSTRHDCGLFVIIKQHCRGKEDSDEAAPALYPGPTSGSVLPHYCSRCKNCTCAPHISPLSIIAVQATGQGCLQSNPSASFYSKMPTSLSTVAYVAIEGKEKLLSTLSHMERGNPGQSKQQVSLFRAREIHCEWTFGIC